MNSQIIDAFTHIIAIVVSLDVDDRQLEPELIHAQHLSVADQHVYSVALIIADGLEVLSVAALDLVPLEGRWRIT